MPGSARLSIALKSNLLSEIELRFSCNWWSHESQKGSSESSQQVAEQSLPNSKKENLCWCRLNVITQEPCNQEAETIPQNSRETTQSVQLAIKEMY